ncbi:MAG: site-specific DNA-methyltransferase [Candidatus Poribacteria bacterium]|nr:site-specific DNA-methyltransferase [Candidatus Poribacteria bacterium]
MPTLDFKGKQFIYGHHLTVPVRTLKIDVDKSLTDDNDPSLNDNLIIHGDNLHALKALLPKYAGKIKCIYIDPPYNTGNENWVYNDNVSSPMMQEWLEKHSPVDVEDLERHDKWLCMMWPRLHLLHELLADDGVIFISIDDNEIHNLRLLMDEIFDAGNFVANLIWRKKAGGGQDTEYYAREHEYILSYRKSDSYTMKFRTSLITEAKFPKIKNGRKCQFLKLEKWGSGAYREDRPTLFYAITDPDGNAFFPKAPDGRDGRWRKQPTDLDETHIHWEKRKDRWTPYEVIYFDEVEDTAKIVKERSIYYDIATTTDATNEQKAIFGEKVFDTSKPLDLIKRLVLLSTTPDSLILDSFAGSGTTAHAVLALNKEDGGNRKFILIECEDYADTITAERVLRVINGVETAKDETLRNGLGGSFTYCTLGEPIDEEGMLTGENLPTYEDLAHYIAYTATGSALTSIKKRKDYCFGETNAIRFYLIYEPTLQFLESSASALDGARAEQIAKACKESGKSAYVYAPQKFISQKELTSMGITFCQLPYNIHRIAEA